MSEPDSVRVALLQINPTVGDLDGNARLHRRRGARGLAAGRPRGARARAGPVRLSARRPAAAPGLPARQRRGARRARARAGRLRRPASGRRASVGWRGGQAGSGDHEDDVRSKSVSVPRVFNAASVLAGGRVAATYCKRELPNYQVFDERRYFVSGRDAGLAPVVFEAGGTQFGVLICEDAWFDEPGAARQGRRRRRAVRDQRVAVPPRQAGRPRGADGASRAGHRPAAAVRAHGRRPGRGRVRRRLVRARRARRGRRARARCSRRPR